MDIKETVLMLKRSKIQRERWVGYFLENIQKLIKEIEEMDLMENPRSGIEKFDNILEEAQEGRDGIAHMIYMDNFIHTLTKIKEGKEEK